jgi:hypothetical protein
LPPGVEGPSSFGLQDGAVGAALAEARFLAFELTPELAIGVSCLHDALPNPLRFALKTIRTFAFYDGKGRI